MSEKTETPKIVRKWKIPGGSEACQHKDGNYSWGRYFKMWTAGYLEQKFGREDNLVKVIHGDFGPPTWEDPEYFTSISVEEELAASPVPIPLAPSKCRFATPKIIAAIEGETVELWRFEAPEEVQLAPARERVLRRAKRSLRDIPLCPGRELPVSLVVQERIEEGVIGQNVRFNRNARVFITAAFVCPHCSGGGE